MAENFNLSTFRNRVHSIGRNQYYAIRIPQVGDEGMITAMSRNTTMPAKQHENLDVSYRGGKMKIADKPQYPDWNVTFLCDEAHSLRHVFMKWMEKQYNILTLTNEPHGDYKRDGLSVSQLSANLEPTSTAIFYGAYPSNVGEIELNQDGGVLETFQVTFTYDYYVMNSLAGDIIFSEEDLTVGADGRYEGVSIQGVGGVNLNF
jgi:hypothetical protein